jgi:hypothetical protein
MHFSLHGPLPQAYNRGRVHRWPPVQGGTGSYTYEGESVWHSQLCEQVSTVPVVNKDDQARVDRQEACVGDCGSGLHGIEGEYWRWCPRCGHELHNEKCKLLCERCHYFLSCSDFD